MAERRYFDYNSYLRSIFGERVQKITVDAGLGCPNRDGTLSRGGCVYCNSLGSGSGLFKKGLTIPQQIEQGRKAMIIRYKARKFLVYFQSYTNTYTTCGHIKEMIDMAVEPQDVVGLAIGTRPDCVDEEKLDLIATYTETHLVWMEYGLQSVHNATLKRINRGHDFSAFENAVHMTRHRGINICAHVILGLPGETREMMLETARQIGRLGINGVKIHLLYVVKGTVLEAMWKKGAYQCMDQKSYVETVCDFIELLPENMVIQRITGDPHPEELVAPAWSLNRNKTFTMIQNTMESRGSSQGIKSCWV
ncbi:MAG: TIGR01212 family radical SAM protein [Thermodesulfobacteriota bacterium]|nr:TIGR01212 family radical SAM protein [Thermodesulfobacteriota bacterium]